MKEKDLFPYLKNHFKEKGYIVYVEIPLWSGSIDLVAVKDLEQIAVEMKMSFNNYVFRQASRNSLRFPYSYIAYPVKKSIIFDNPDIYHKLREGVRVRYENCVRDGIGIIQILPRGTLFYALEAKYKKPYNNKLYDFSQYDENENDEAGLPCQKGVSAGYYELKLIKEYVKNHPLADWKEIYLNVQNHYSSPQSLSGSMGQWRGFNLREYKNSLTPAHKTKKS